MRLSSFQNQTAPRSDGVLGVLGFSALGNIGPEPEAPHLQVYMRRLDGGDAHCETWHGQGQLTRGRHGDVRYSHDGETLFGVVTVNESELDPRAGSVPLRQAAARAYGNVFELVDALGFAHLYRFWNYLSDINKASHGLERYRQFNLGRQDAFLARGYGEADGFPAACALGSARGPLSLAFLAGHAPPQRIENPRQVSAYHYPERYGPRSPLFSRATRVKLRHRDVLLISGTASVVGHATLHAHDVIGQTRETLANLQALLDETNRATPYAAFDWRHLACRVYVRNPADWQHIQAELERGTGQALNAVYLQADICRADLLVEIEATGMRAGSVLLSGAEG